MKSIDSNDYYIFVPAELSNHINYTAAVFNIINVHSERNIRPMKRTEGGARVSGTSDIFRMKEVNEDI